ncbi:DUF4334 domain-containing protein [Nocardioides sp. zg-536]|uniref:DUF4334 domain-containing protein n=1 Tax=Nocardioides faecalis TaxID=2803858 RepID=A0A938YCL1_9ACTN|nr:DUF4334 domain-containing protein [Nocardioides faecalis]MBM9461389.1 DUF4334 domain-containing protein [Nocardioides faecalis]QVI57651.1 DUF4334 domain-containing protein [Nocardioides faecalis]
MADITERFDALRAAEDAAPADLDALWSELSTVTVPEMLGAWRGGDFATGHVLSDVLRKIRWHGKRFEGPLVAVPLVCRDEAGELYSNTKAAGGGEASLWEVGFRGETTATMVYDNLPVLDHFKKVDDDTVMGIMNGKLDSAFGIADLYYFWLEREA